jgi:hypothetical protein
MISLSKIRDLMKKDSANERPAADAAVDSDEPTPPPVQVRPRNIAEHDDAPTTSAFSIKPPGDTQELNGDAIHEQLDGLKRTLDANAFERKKERNEQPPKPFGNEPPTVEMERPPIEPT